MKPRKQPILATWLLDLFCSGREYESVAGDVIEQYHQGRGRLWYWRQVVGIVLFGLYDNVARHPLISTHRFPMGLIVTAVFIVLSLAAVLMSGIGPLLLAPVILGGGIAGFRWYTRTPPQDVNVRHTMPLSDARTLVRIDSSKITVRGGLGTGVLIVMLLTAALHDVALLRVWALPGLLAGPVVAICLRIWANLHPRDIDKEWPSILPK
jgi:hypothetical protein